ncbi:PAS domain S-box protein [Halorientalis marina]|uniref:PAS domain S-box protein n=1 Tax=Halorientalis marina TaxID=2931976 RepID=UPI001FF53C32|nr:PAS domain S-box protein [Halorientalis marina]
MDDEPDFAELAGTFLQREDERFKVETATSADRGLDHLANTHVDCIVSDYDMPGVNGLEFLKTVRENHPDLPFILFTGKGSEEIASEAISAGVTDYLQKGSGTEQYTLLANRIRNVTEKWRAQREAEQTRSRLEAITSHSPDAILTIDSQSTITFANAAVEDLFGYTPGSLVDKSLTELIPPRYRDNHLDGFQRYLETDERTMDWQAIEFTAQHHDGHEIPISISFGEFQEDGERRFVGIIRNISERVRMEEQLQERERRFEQMAENIQEVVWMSDPEKEEIFYVNPAFATIWGQSPEELYEDPTAFFDAIHPDDRDRVKNALPTQREGRYDEEYRIVRPDGTVRWVWDRAVPVENDAGEVYRIIGIASDITEQKERERESERLQDMFEATERIADVGGWEIDTETQDVFWSDHLFRMLGREADQAPPLEQALDVYVKEDRPAVERAVEEALARGESFDVEARFERSDGEIRWFQILGEPTLDGGDVVTLRGAVQDITDHKQRERELEQARAEYEELFNGMNDTAWVIDSDGEFLAVNDAAVEQTGYARDELLSMRPHDIDAELDEGKITMLIDDMPDDEVQVFETVHETKDGEEIPVEICSTLITYHGEQAILSIGRDISNRKQREKQLDEFASVVSHDLRNPLGVAEGHVELAQETCDSEHLSKVADAHDRMEVLIEDLLTLAREGNSIGEVESIDLVPFVRECWQTVDTAEARLVLETSHHIKADRTRLKQLFENFIRNAIEHGGSDVTITIGEVEDGFFIEDDGTGIAPENRTDVFDIGYSTTHNGTGFGLSIVEQIAEAHGWNITVTEGAEGGARFEITGVELTE